MKWHCPVCGRPTKSDSGFCTQGHADEWRNWPPEARAAASVGNFIRTTGSGLMSERSFVELALDGRATLDEIDDFIDRWHDSGDDEERELHEYLGLTWNEYALWVERPASLGQILNPKEKR